MKYNYYDAIANDIRQYLADHNFTAEDYEDEHEAFKAFYDDMFMDDSVTGNASGSYTFNTWTAEENISHNLDLLERCAEEFGDEPTITTDYRHGAEWWDVSIRCYLLAEVLADVLADMF